MQIAPVMIRTFNYYCNPVDYSNNPDSIALLSGSYIYFLTKIMDLLDTVTQSFQYSITIINLISLLINYIEKIINFISLR